MDPTYIGPPGGVRAKDAAFVTRPLDDANGRYGWLRARSEAEMTKGMAVTVRAVLDQPHFLEGLNELAQTLDLPLASAQAQAARALREMWTQHQPWPTGAWQAFGRTLTKRYDVRVRADAERLRALDAHHPLIILFSHRSYLDTWLLRDAILDVGLSPTHDLAGANLDFWPIGPVLRRTGALFIRRDTKDDRIYRYVLRSYIRCLLANGANLAWSIEGGRTRTGKLRPPRYGALRYVVDALQASDGPETYVLPISVVYDQLTEVATMAGEATGARKRPEDLRWLVKYSVMQRRQGGVARVDIGEPLPLRARIAELAAGPKPAGAIVERIALDVCHRINRVTPATPTALVAFALLAAERALTLTEVESTLQPILAYLADRAPHLDTLQAELLTEADWVEQPLGQLVEAGVLTRFEDGKEPVFQIAADQHLVAAFYRNTLVHFLVSRAIGELVMFMVRDHTGDVREAIWQRALQLRDLLKFEFFFARRSDFQSEFMQEVERIDPEWEGRHSVAPVVTAQRVGLWFERTRPHVAHVVLRPFFDAYLLVADELTKEPSDRAVDQAALSQRCLGVGYQRVLQRKLHSAESVTLEIFRNALLLAEHRGLLTPTGDDLPARRLEFAAELRAIVSDLAQLAASEDPVQPA